MIEFLQDLIEQNPAEAIPREHQANVVFRTGDKVIDKWERQLAKGEAIEVLEAFRPEEHAFVKRYMSNRDAVVRKKQFLGSAAPPEGFSDQYKKKG